MKFELQGVDSLSRARACKITTSHGEVLTPIFMPVGTAGTVKAVHQRELKHDIKAQIILGNTYHLYLRPGTDILQKAGGLHLFNGWEKPILTDSGGYQVFSLSQNRKLSEEGAIFQSHLDGSRHLFSPERVIEIERKIGADIVMAFDECPPYPSNREYTEKSMHLTHRWLSRCIEHFNKTEPLYGYPQSLFPIVQGGTFRDLRTDSAQFVAAQNLPGNAIGGLSVGEPAEIMYELTELVCSILPTDKPRYLMGVGTPANLLEAIALGVDMFDCVMPTRNARNGLIYTTKGILNMRNNKWKDDFSPIDQGLDCFVSQSYSKAYLRHLTICDEILAAQIASIQNLTFYLWLVGQAREQILAGNYQSWKKAKSSEFMQRL